RRGGRLVRRPVAAERCGGGWSAAIADRGRTAAERDRRLLARAGRAAGGRLGHPGTARGGGAGGGMARGPGGGGGGAERGRGAGAARGDRGGDGRGGEPVSHR